MRIRRSPEGIDYKFVPRRHCDSSRRHSFHHTTFHWQWATRWGHNCTADTQFRTTNSKNRPLNKQIINVRHGHFERVNRKLTVPCRDLWWICSITTTRRRRRWRLSDVTDGGVRNAMTWVMNKARQWRQFVDFKRRRKLLGIGGIEVLGRWVDIGIGPWRCCNSAPLIPIDDNCNLKNKNKKKKERISMAVVFQESSGLGGAATWLGQLKKKKKKRQWINWVREGGRVDDLL